MMRWVVGTVLICSLLVGSQWAVAGSAGGPAVQRVKDGVSAEGFSDRGEIIYYVYEQGPQQNLSVYSTTQGLLARPGQNILQHGLLVDAYFVGLTGQDVPVLLGTYQPPSGVADALFTPTQWLLDTVTPFPFTTMIDGHRLQSIDQAAVNQQGQLVLRGLTDHPTGATAWGIAQLGGGWLALPGSVIDGTPIFSATGGVAVNALGAVVFTAVLDSTFTTNGLFTPASKITATGDQLYGQTVHAVFDGLINDWGEIIYGVQLDYGTVLQSTWRGAIAWTGQSVDGHTISVVDIPSSLNNLGEMLWQGGYDGTQYGLFSNQRGLIVSDNDSLLGKQIQALNNGILNNQGQIALTVGWTDGTASILVFPGPWREAVYGDLDGDGQEDMVAVGLDSTLWRCLAGQACTQLPGRALHLVLGDFDGNGTVDLVALAADTSIWAMLDGQHWQQVPGRLKHLVAGHYTTTQHMQLAGIGSDGSIWRGTTLGSWQHLPGSLRAIVTGDLNGDGRDDLAGIGFDANIYTLTDGLGTWQRIPGSAKAIVAGHLVDPHVVSLLVIARDDASIWLAADSVHFTQLAGSLTTLMPVAGAQGGVDGVAGVGANGLTYYAATAGAFVQVPPAGVVASHR